VSLPLPELIPNFDDLDRQVRALDPASAPQPAGAIVRFDGRSLHRAVAAHDAGWRLWVRCAETDRRVELTPRSSSVTAWSTGLDDAPRRHLDYHPPRMLTPHRSRPAPRLPGGAP
jgi:hypothetical protein